jgi:imidazoleglycerol-phosphate dehydratase/histidinol-phosphatase
MFAEYLNDKYDIANSYVICNNTINVKLAKDMGCKAILVGVTDTTEIDKAEELHACIAYSANDWKELYAFLRKENRTATVTRKTNETDIVITVDLDGTGKANIATGLHFFDHMLDQIARHSGVDLTIAAKGDLHIDEHHTIEDVALALGEAFQQALGDKRGTERYGFLLPMDEASAKVSVDFSGRPWLVWHADFKREKIGEMPTEMFMHFFKSWSDAAKANLNIYCEGTNEHHKIESIFKAWAKAIRMAITRDKTRLAHIPSTKGVL